MTISTSVRPDGRVAMHPAIVEGLSFFFPHNHKKGQGFDKLSPNGIL